MPTYQEWIVVGQEAGLAGDALHEFVRNEQKYERDQRAEAREEKIKREEEQSKIDAHERDVDRLKIEAKIKADEAQLTKEKLETEAQLTKEKLETEAKIKSEQDVARREHELAMAAAGYPEPREPGRADQPSASLFSRGLKPKLPTFNDGDDLTAFLTKFERMAEMMQVRKEEFAAMLGSCLQGYAVQVYASLSPEVTSDYDALKQGLLTAYNQGTESFRRRFRDLKILQNQSYEQYSIALRRLLLLWIDAEEHAHDFESMVDFLVKDQLLRTASGEIRTFVQEHNVHKLNEVVTLAHNYSVAHMNYAKIQYKGTNPESVPVVNTGKSNLRQSGKTKFQSPQVQNKPGQFINRNYQGAYRPPFNARFNQPNAPGRSFNANIMRPSAPPVRPATPRTMGQCWHCGDPNHLRNNCPTIVQPVGKVPLVPTGNQVVRFCIRNDRPRKWVVAGTVNATLVTDIVRDSGCSAVVVLDKLVPTAVAHATRTVKMQDYLGRVDVFPVARVHISCPYFVGWTEAILAPLRNASALIGNVPGASDVPQWDQSMESFESGKTSFENINNKVTDSASDHVAVAENTQFLAVNAVTTRAGKTKQSKAPKPMIVPMLPSINIEADKFLALQLTCPTLKTLRDAEAKNLIISTRDQAKFQIIKRDQYYLRKCIDSKKKSLIGSETLLVPEQCRRQVLLTTHESLFAGHFSNRKTEMLIRTQFFWPGMSAQIKRFVQSCAVCQTHSMSRPAPAPLGRIPIITEPFSRVSMDLIGPFVPCTDEGHRYILSIIDVASGYPECVPLKNIDSISVAEALISFFSKFGIPREILSDQGRQFISKLLDEVHRILDIRPVFSSAYHSQSHGRIERLNRTVQTCLRKLCVAKPTQWHKYLPAIMFAIREIPSDRTGFSPFQLLFGRTVRGPVTILRELWENPQLDADNRDSFQYVLDLKERLALGANLAAENSQISVNKYTSYFDLKSKKRSFLPEQEVLVLLPDTTSKLTMAWSGPYKILEKRTRVNYLVDLNGTPKVFHVNLLKRFMRRDPQDEINPLDEMATINGPIQTCRLCIIEDDILDTSNAPTVKMGEIQTLDLDDPMLPQIDPLLSDEQKETLRNLVVGNADVFSNVPGCTDTVVHSIQLTTATPIRAKMYPIPIALQEHFNNEVDNLLSLGIITPADSPYSSPPLLVMKREGTYRLAMDYRCLNSITVFNAEPIHNIEEDLHRFADSKYFSELDLISAFFQVPIDAQSQPYTAFPTAHGQMMFTRVAFGLINAPSVFVKLMRKVLMGLAHVIFYFDNIVIHTETWDEHIAAVMSVVHRLRLHKLTLKPVKCKLGFEQIDYLGFVIGPGGILRTQPDKVFHLASIPPPKTKKQLRSFLGMIAFYRKFIPNCSELTCPLSDLTKITIKEPLPWTEEANVSFNRLKDALCSDPILKLPNIALPFILRTDASSTMVAATLMQKYDEVPHPLAYYSRKLLPRERNYSTIERECLAILNGIEKFKYYLLGRHFFIETDHLGLVWLNKSKNLNSRLIRWALLLQNYRFTVVHILGKDNVFSDFLSRNDGN